MLRINSPVRVSRRKEQEKMMKGYQKQYLKGIAHKMKPTVFIGQKGLPPSVVDAVEVSLEKHELIKVKFIDFKEKGSKQEIAGRLENETGATLVGMIGHIAIFYRPQKDPKKQKIHLPEKKP